MKSRACFAAEVVQTDAFLSLSLEAQLLYLLMGHHQDVCGRIIGASRIVRGYGFDPESLQELMDSGYLISVDGLTVDRFTWTNNAYDARLKSRADSFDAFKAGRIGFEGEPFKSAYTLTDDEATEQRRYSDDEAPPNATSTQCNDNGNRNPKPTEHNSNPSRNANAAHEGEAAQGETVKERKEGASSSTATQESQGQPQAYACTCKQCGSTEATCTPNGDATSTIHCEACGDYEFDPHGTRKTTPF